MAASNAQQSSNLLTSSNSDVNETNDGKELKLTFDLTGINLYNF